MNDHFTEHCILKIQFATKNTFAKINDIGGALAHPGTPHKSSLFHSVLKKTKNSALNYVCI